MPALFVGDLHPEVTELMLEERFSPVGRIRSIWLYRDRKTGSSLGYAYVNFQKRADAERALEMLNFEDLMGQPMRVLWWQKDSCHRKTSIGNLFIKNLSKSVDSKDLYDTFSKYGKVVSCKVVGYKMWSKGYGYVHFESVEAADLAMAELNGKLLDDCKMVIEHYKAPQERQAKAGSGQPLFTKVYIKNLSEDVDDKMLSELFSEFGPLLKVSVATDENGKSKGFGVGRFERYEDAQRALTELNGKWLNGKQLCVGREKAKMKKETQLKHESEQAQNLAAYDTPSQEVEPHPYMLWSGPTFGPLLFQHLFQPALVHQQTGGTIPPSTTQVPWTRSECTHMTTPTSLDTVEVEDTVSAVNTVSWADIVRVKETVPAVDSIPVPVPAADDVSGLTQGADEDESLSSSMASVSDVQQNNTTETPKMFFNKNTNKKKRKRNKR